MMGNRLRACKPSPCRTSHPGLLSLATPLWVGAMSTSLGWEGHRIGLASHMPCVTDNCGIATYWIYDMSGRWAPQLRSFWGVAFLYLYLLVIPPEATPYRIGSGRKYGLMPVSKKIPRLVRQLGSGPCLLGRLGSGILVSVIFQIFIGIISVKECLHERLSHGVERRPFKPRSL